MSNAQTGGGDERRGLQGTIESITDLPDGTRVTVRLQNPSNRAIHYISDVRAMVFDPLTRRLIVRLSDRGLELVPGAMAKEPHFQMIDPLGEAVITIALPRTIVKLASGPPSDEVAFEEHVVADAGTVELEIGWADTPYYGDPRSRARRTSPVSEWEQGGLALRFERNPRRR